MNMIVVTEIKTLKVPDDWAEYTRCIVAKIPVDDGECTDYMAVDEVIELVKGRRYRNPRNNTDMVIGYGTEAEKILGITYDCFDKSEQLRKESETKLLNKEIELDKLIKIKKDNDFKFYLMHGYFLE